MIVLDEQAGYRLMLARRMCQEVLAHHSAIIGKNQLCHCMTCVALGMLNVTLMGLPEDEDSDIPVIKGFATRNEDTGTPIPIQGGTDEENADAR